jgi:hypothetical protein
LPRSIDDVQQPVHALAYVFQAIVIMVTSLHLLDARACSIAAHASLSSCSIPGICAVMLLLSQAKF